MASATSVNRRPRGGEMSASARRRRRWREAGNRSRGEGEGQALPITLCDAESGGQPAEERVRKANRLRASGCRCCFFILLVPLLLGYAEEL